MLTMKTIMSQIQEGDWFVTIDLKDAYFYIQVVQRHRRFLRFAFGGKAYKYKVLPFGLALAPRTFTKCTDAALAPLRLQGIRVLNYLDDWLILAHSMELVSRHRDIVLRHIHSLGLRMNAKKSVLLPSQRTLFLGVHLDSIQMQARLAPARISNFYSMSGPLQARPACLCRFMPQAARPHGSGLPCVAPRVASHEAVPLVDEGAEVTPHCTSHSPYQGVARLLSIPFTMAGPRFFWSSVRIGAIHRRHMVTTDASMMGWGAVFEGRPASGDWTGEFLSWHINCLELRAVFLALMYFLPVLGGHHIIVRTDNMAVVSHINHQGGSRSRTLDRLARHLLLWSQYKFLSLRTVHVPGILNLAADFVKTETQAGRMDVEPSDNIPDLGSVWQSGSGPLCFSRVIPVPALVLPEFPDDSGHRCVRPLVAECHAVRVSANKADSGSTMQSKGEQCPSPSHSPILALPDLVLGVNFPLVSAPWEIPIRQDLLSQLQSRIWHPNNQSSGSCGYGPFRAKSRDGCFTCQGSGDQCQSPRY